MSYTSFSSFTTVGVLVAALACARPAPHAAAPGAPAAARGAADGSLSPAATTSFIEGEIASIAGDHARAAAAYAAALSMDQGNLFLLSSQAAALAAAGKKEKALAVLDEVLGQDPAFEAALLVAGDVKARAGDAPGAAGCFAAAVAAAPGSPEGYLGLVGLATAAGDAQAAFAAAMDLVENVPGFAPGYAEAARAAFALGKTALAGELMLSYASLLPKGGKTGGWDELLGIGLDMVDAGEEAYGLALLEAYRAACPGDVAAAAGAVTALVRLGRLADARVLAAGVAGASELAAAELLFAAGDWEGAGAALGAAAPGEVTGAKAKVILAAHAAFAMRIEEAEALIGSFGPQETAWRAEALGLFLLMALSGGAGGEALPFFFADPAMPAAAERFDVMQAAAAALAAGAPADPKQRAAALARLGETPQGKLVLAWSDFLAGAEGAAGRSVQAADALLAARPAGEGAVAARAVKGILAGEKLVEATPNLLLDLVVKIRKDDGDRGIAAALSARYFALTGNDERAAHWYETAAGARPADAMVRVWRAEWLLADGRKDEAREEATAALLLKPPKYWSTRALALIP